jgi:hypothetical protein
MIQHPRTAMIMINTIQVSQPIRMDSPINIAENKENDMRIIKWDILNIEFSPILLFICRASSYYAPCHLYFIILPLPPCGQEFNMTDLSIPCRKKQASPARIPACFKLIR